MYGRQSAIRYPTAGETALAAAHRTGNDLAAIQTRGLTLESRRLRQLRLVSAIAVEISSVRTVDQLLWEVVRHVQRAFGYYYVHILTIDPGEDSAICQAAWDRSGPRRDLIGMRLRIRDEGLVGWVAWTGEPELVTDVRKDPRYYLHEGIPHSRSELTVPILRAGRTIGILDAQDRKPGAFDADDLLVLETLARQISVALDNAELLEQLAASRAALEQKAAALDTFVELMTSSQDDDRRRIAFELHDGALQLLAGAHFQVETMQMATSSLSPALTQGLDFLAGVLKECSTDMRRVIFDLYPPDLASLGLVPTIQRYKDTVSRLFGFHCAVSVVGDAQRLVRERELAAFRFVQEALANAFKHAEKASVEVALVFGGTELTITVRDEGPGFVLSERALAGGLGLQSMQRNAARAKGRFDLRSAPGAGTAAILTIPIEGG